MVWVMLLLLLQRNINAGVYLVRGGLGFTLLGGQWRWIGGDRDRIDRVGRSGERDGGRDAALIGRKLGTGRIDSWMEAAEETTGFPWLVVTRRTVCLSEAVWTSGDEQKTTHACLAAYLP